MKTNRWTNKNSEKKNKQIQLLLKHNERIMDKEREHVNSPDKSGTVAVKVLRCCLPLGVPLARRASRSSRAVFGVARGGGCGSAAFARAE